MKKRCIAFAAVLAAMSALFAYNPPAGGESIYRLAEPNLLADAGSASGGPLFTVVPGSIAFNPAVTALNQRVVADASYTMLIDTTAENTSTNKIASGFQLGTIIPSKWCVSTVVVQGLFVPFPSMNLGNSINIHAGVSKDVTDQLYVGLNAYFGTYFGYGSDFTVGADVGLLYLFKKIGFLTDPRLGVSFMNLGKPLGAGYVVTGIDGTTADVSYPGIVTPHVSFAATLFTVKKVSGGFSADISAPFFQNAVFDTAFACTYNDMVRLSIGWNANIRELADGCQVNLPSIGLAVKFAVNASGISKANADWAKSEICASSAWQRLYGGIQAISGGVTMNLGMKDTAAPEIILWNDEE